MREIDFGPDYQPWAIGQQIRTAGLQWLWPEARTKEQVVESVLIEHFMPILPFKPKNWVLCHQPATLEEAIMLMEAYMSVEAGLYLMPRSLKKKAEK